MLAFHIKKKIKWTFSSKAGILLIIHTLVLEYIMWFAFNINLFYVVTTIAFQSSKNFESFFSEKKTLGLGSFKYLSIQWITLCTESKWKP